jgi:hypothetical protein
MKSGTECLKALPREIQIKWMRNVIKQHGAGQARFILCSDDEYTLRLFVSGSFTWAQSKEGHKYWERISNGIFPSQNKIVNL